MLIFWGVTYLGPKEGKFIFMVEQEFLPPERLVNTYCRCIMLTGREEAQMGRGNFMLKFFLPCFIIWTFLVLLKISARWGSPTGSPSHSPHLPLGEDQMASSRYRSEWQWPGWGGGLGRGGQSFPCPSPTALLAWLLWPWWHKGCWALRLCILE